VFIFENDHFVVARKPGGVLTVPSHQGRDDPRPILGIQLQEQLGIQIFPVHRLDFEVSGLVLFAKSRDAHQHANQWFEHQLVKKTYRAWTQTQNFAHIPAHIANPRQALTLAVNQTFDWHGRIARGKRRAYQSVEGKDSITHAQYLGPEPAQGFLCWDLEPLTGRPHQLRVDLSRHGFPVVGDNLYGATSPCQINMIALVAYRLDLTAIPQTQRLGLPAQLFIEPRFTEVCAKPQPAAN
jgi:tRNA pseudouridine32 synthase/23S rRNA pseudouridine746 synthase